MYNKLRINIESIQRRRKIYRPGQVTVQVDGRRAPFSRPLLLLGQAERQLMTKTRSTARHTVHMEATRKVHGDLSYPNVQREGTGGGRRADIIHIQYSCVAFHLED